MTSNDTQSAPTSVPTSVPTREQWFLIADGEGRGETAFAFSDAEIVEWLWQQCGHDWTGNEEHARNNWFAYLEDGDHWSSRDGYPRWCCEIEVGETGHVTIQRMTHALRQPSAGEWVPWKPGDAMPTAGGVYATTRERHGVAYRKLTIALETEWATADDPVIAYLPSPVPSPYEPPPPRSADGPTAAPGGFSTEEREPPRERTR